MSTIVVNAGGNLQAALDSAVGGDIVQLEAAATFTGNFTLPVHSGASPVIVQSAGTLPGSTTRVSPTTAAGFATVQASSGGSPALATAPAANYWSLVGLHLPNNPGGFGDILDLGDGSSAQTLLSQVPQFLTVDRCYIHGSTTVGQKRGIGLNSGDTTIKNCYINDIFLVGQDTQAIAGWNGPGPYLIDNNYLEAAGENFLIGGNATFIANNIPSDITFTRNAVAKPIAWRGRGYTIKNLLELKVGQRVSIDLNTFDYNWGGEGQSGEAFQFTVRNEDGSNPWATIRDLQFTRNIIRHVGGGINILGLDDRAGFTSVLMTNVLIQDNLFWDVAEAYGGSAQFLRIQRGDAITVNHNTAVLTQAGQAVTIYLINGSTSNFVCTNNILPNDGLTVFGTNGQANGIPTLQDQAPGYVFARNVIYGPTPFNYPPDAFYPPTIQDVGFNDLAASDYRLSPTSVYIGAALDGTDIGARFTVPPPVPPTPPTTPPTVPPIPPVVTPPVPPVPPVPPANVPPPVPNQVITSDGSYVYTADLSPVVVSVSTTGSRLTQLPLAVAYDYAVLQPHLGSAGLQWATPPKAC